MFTNVFPPYFQFLGNDSIDFYLVKGLLKILRELFCGSREEVGLSFFYLRGVFRFCFFLNEDVF